MTVTIVLGKMFGTREALNKYLLNELNHQSHCILSAFNVKMLVFSGK